MISNLNTMSRISKEKATVEFMIRFYCRRKHRRNGDHGEGLCPECRELMEYAVQRLDRCPYGEKKKACRHCSIHCYRPDMRERIRAVMRYSGPRMFFFSPIQALKHI